MHTESGVQTPASQTLLGWVLAAQTHYVLLCGLLPGFTLVFASLPLNIGFLTAKAPAFAPIDREVGYLAALNWSLTYAVLLPASLYLMVAALQGIAEALDRLHARGMVRDTDQKIVPGTRLCDDWVRGTPTRTRLLLFFAVMVPAAFALVEWFFFNFLRLLHRGPSAEQPDYDWGLAGLMHGPGQPEASLVHRLANAAFDLLAFSTEGVLIGTSLAFFLLLLDLGRVLPDRKNVLRLVPDLRSQDRRRGFEVFAEPLQKVLGVALLSYLALYCVRLEGVYMKSQSAESLGAFVQSDIWRGAIEAATSLKGSETASTADGAVSVVKYLFRTGDQTVRGALAWLVAMLLFCLSFIVVAITVREAAIRGRSNVGELRQRSLYGGPVASERERARTMVVWPLEYPSLSTILIAMLLGACTLYLYRIGLFVAGFIVAALLFKLMKAVLVQPADFGAAAANEPDVD